MAEIEALSEEKLFAVPRPSFAIREATDELFYTGGQLILTTAVQLQTKRQAEFT
ncbi:MAG: hypothetical protein GY796_03415 [Chloroflexi bacterium]|nr:hypothetical protein [Chloroflexota bacterium]